MGYSREPRLPNGIQECTRQLKERGNACDTGKYLCHLTKQRNQAENDIEQVEVMQDKNGNTSEERVLKR